MLKRLLITLLVITAFAVKAKATPRWDPNTLTDPFTVDSTQYVLDPLKYLSPAGLDSINQIAQRLKNEVNIEYAVVVLDKLDDNDDIFSFSQNLYEAWGLGQNDRGLLFVTFIEQRQFRFHTGYGVEDIFPDGLLSVTEERLIVPNFRSKEYSKGIYDASQFLFLHAQKYERGEETEQFDDSTQSIDDFQEQTEDFFIFYLLLFLLVSCIIFASTVLKLTTKYFETDVNASCNTHKNKSISTYTINAPNGDVFESYFNNKHLAVRLIVILVITIITLLVIEETTDPFWGYVIGFAIYPSILLTIRYFYLEIMIGKLYKGKSVELYNKYNILIHSRKMIFFCIVTPFVSIPALLYFRLKRKEAFENCVKIPQSQWETCIGDISQYTDEDASKVSVYRTNDDKYIIATLSGQTTLFGVYKKPTLKKILLFVPAMILGLIIILLIVFAFAGLAGGRGGGSSSGGRRGGGHSGGGGASGSW